MFRSSRLRLQSQRCFGYRGSSCRSPEDVKRALVAELFQSAFQESVRRRFYEHILTRLFISMRNLPPNCMTLREMLAIRLIRIRARFDSALTVQGADPIAFVLTRLTVFLIDPR